MDTRESVFDITSRMRAAAVHDREDAAWRHLSRIALAGQLSAAIVHQLRQPLSAILGNAEIAQKMLDHGQVEVAELREICRDVIAENQRASDLIARLSEFYRRGDMKVEPVDVDPLIRETLDLLRTELMNRRVVPVFELAPVLPTIGGDRVGLQQVVLNLVLNAADAMSEAPAEDRKLTVRTEKSGQTIRLYVTDNGTGIAAESLERIFDPFWSTKSGGVGMGLAICRSIVNWHGGSITAANNAGRGATFCVALPTDRKP